MLQFVDVQTTIPDPQAMAPRTRFQRTPNILITSAIALIAACAPPPTSDFSEADEAAIMASEAAWEAAEDARDWAGLAAIYAEDAVFLAPNMPELSGRAAIEEWHAATPEGAELDLEIVQISGSGDLAYVYGTYEMSYPVGGETVNDSGRYVEIRRKAADGSWPIVLDIFNSDVPLPEPKM
jgi:uncharacterized protein (TIGR02246 family)